jgi:hypothetical protein
LILLRCGGTRHRWRDRALVQGCVTLTTSPTNKQTLGVATMPEETALTDNASINGYLDAIDRADDELASLRGSYMSQCRGPRATISEIKGSAREAGVNMKAFDVILKGHRDERKQAKRIAELEGDDIDAFEEMAEALGEFASTPLGSAALEGARPKRGARRKDDSLDSLHGA